MKVASPRIAVIGLGSAGSMALWRLAARGADAVGSLPGTDRVTGLSGHGFKLAPVLGDIAADYSLAGQSSSNLALLDPGRFAGMSDSTGLFTS
jgi:glycine/D-amino acid oxidase-like deaminating enzyme